MSNYPSTMLERSTLTFCIAGLHARDELLFKAFVRLLDHLTHQHWRYQAPAEALQIELLVTAEGMLAEYSAIQTNQCLQLGATGLLRPGFLHWPLKPDELEKELNRVGAQCLAARAKPSAAMWPINTAVGAATHESMRTTAIRLRQWPPADLLTGTGRMRLATLLTGKAITLDELAGRANLPLALCEAFVAQLHQAKLLIVYSTRENPAQSLAALVPKPLPTGLLARIRLSLGIF